MKDSIDFGSMDISMLFRKLLVPTVLGMVFSAIFVITDGIFVGKGIGSDALAAVNITAPLFMIATGIGLMFGVGGSVVASIYLSQGKRKAATPEKLKYLSPLKGGLKPGSTIGYRSSRQGMFLARPTSACAHQPGKDHSGYSFPDCADQ